MTRFLCTNTHIYKTKTGSTALQKKPAGQIVYFCAAEQVAAAGV
jgi:hypothetical protein